MISAIAGPLANHLWQSTLFAVIAGLLSLALAKNHARVRYWIWLTSSMKFRVPFSMLIALGSSLGWLGTRTIVSQDLSLLIEDIGQPFASPPPARAVPVRVARVAPILTEVLPQVLVVLWLCGCVAILVFWWVRWRRVSTALCQAVPVGEGR